MNFLDLIILFLMAGALIQGYKWGLILQITSLVNYILAIWIAFEFTDEFAPVISKLWSLPDSVSGGWMALVPVEKAIYSLIAFVVLLIGTRLLLSLAATLINQVANLPILSAVNRSGGVLFGLAKVLLLTFVLVNVLNVIPWSTGQKVVEGSFLASAVTGWTPDLAKELNQLFQGKML
ncbi:CvpA family protein [Thermoactinomyces mirandus]|uniref:CvpA family protein n=1 Tax=Thermoactinomyces mirandus TaxID=2756294 RepID=A0A7W2AQM8_9BACL|nr:CvpA family protein [Thermoactinomyces mirandus]MBA4601673.1 CvpA family protein [Thermoactinomyces mirandus]